MPAGRPRPCHRALPAAPTDRPTGHRFSSVEPRHPHLDGATDPANSHSSNRWLRGQVPFHPTSSVSHTLPGVEKTGHRGTRCYDRGRPSPARRAGPAEAPWGADGGVVGNGVVLRPVQVVCPFVHLRRPGLDRLGPLAVRLDVPHPQRTKYAQDLLLGNVGRFVGHDEADQILRVRQGLACELSGRHPPVQRSCGFGPLILQWFTNMISLPLGESGSQARRGPSELASKCQVRLVQTRPPRPSTTRSGATRSSCSVSFFLPSVLLT